MATAPITSLRSIPSQHLLHPLLYIVKATITPLDSIFLQQLLRLYDLYGYNGSEATLGKTLGHGE